MKGKRAPFILSGTDSEGGSGAEHQEKKKRHDQGRSVSSTSLFPRDKPPPPPYPYSTSSQSYYMYKPKTPGLFQAVRPAYLYGVQQPSQFTPSPGPRPVQSGKG